MIVAGFSAPPNSAAAEHTGARRAALLVHALPGADRQWLMEQLPATERARIEELLDEIRALGIPSQAGFLPELLASVEEPPRAATATNAMAGNATDTQGAVSRPSQAPHAWPSLRTVAPSTLAAMLRDEPELLARRVLARLEAAQRHAVQRRLRSTHHTFDPLPAAVESDGTRGADRLDQALLAGLLKRSSAERVGAATARRPSRWLKSPWQRVAERSTSALREQT